MHEDTYEDGVNPPNPILTLTLISSAGESLAGFGDVAVRVLERGLVDGAHGNFHAETVPALVRNVDQMLSNQQTRAALVVDARPEGRFSALQTKKASTVAVSGIINGKALKGPADRMLLELGHEVSPTGVARIYQKVASNFVLDNADAQHKTDIEKLYLIMHNLYYLV